MGNIIEIEGFINKIVCSDEYVVYYPDLEMEILELLEKSGYFIQFNKKLAKAVRILEGLGQQCVECSKTFEKLKGNYDLYSIRLKGQKNIRMLFFFTLIKGQEKAVLLVCFEEKDEKDYSDHIPIAMERMRIVKERL